MLKIENNIWVRIDMEFFECSTREENSISTINRVIYGFSQA